MQGKARLGPHPIHPMLIPFPIGFFVGSFVTDLLYLFTGAGFWLSMSLALIGFGIVGALLAAVFGFIDYLTAPMPPAVRRTATRHMLANLAVVALFAVNFYLRGRAPVGTLHYGLSVGALLLLLWSGWLGGALVYEAGVGLAPSATRGAPPGAAEGLRGEAEPRRAG